MPKFNMPKWLTITLAAVYVIVAKMIHMPEIVPPNAVINLGFIHLQLVVALTDLLLLLGFLGINGPQLLPGLAGLLGNPAGPSQPKPPAPPAS